MAERVLARAGTRCGCGAHELHPVPAIGGWLHSSVVTCDILTVRRVAAEHGFWALCDVPRGELTRRIRAAGGIGCDHALEAFADPGGETLMMEGCHRWRVADMLGLREVPVLMPEAMPDD